MILISCHLIINREGKCFISYMGRFINILKKPITYVTPFRFPTIKTLQVALELACFKITEHASMSTLNHEPVATDLGNSIMAAHVKQRLLCLFYPLHPKLSDYLFLPLYLHLCNLMTRY